MVILSIGDEIVEPGREARPGTVFDANGHALSTAIADAGAQTFRVSAVPDERSVLRETIEDQLVRADLILTTGGISYGSGDTVREVLSALGTVRFDSVAAWPGHILGVGTVGGDDQGRAGTPIFCLPGDPVSAQVCFEVYVRPALRHMQGWTVLNRPSVQARVDRSWYSPRGRREFVRVRLVGDPQWLSGEGYGSPGLVAAVCIGRIQRSRGCPRRRDECARWGYPALHGFGLIGTADESAFTFCADSGVGSRSFVFQRPDFGSGW